MAQTLFSLLDLLASRFRSNSENEEENQQPNENNLISVTVSDTEPQSQPRSRSHTETTRPSNLPNQNPNNNNNNNISRPNKSPVLPRQQRSMTTTGDPSKLSPDFLRPQNRNDLLNQLYQKPKDGTTTTTTTTTGATLTGSEVQPQQPPPMNLSESQPVISTSQSMIDNNQNSIAASTDSHKPLMESTNLVNNNMVIGSTDGGIEMQEYIDNESSDGLNYATETPMGENCEKEEPKKEPLKPFNHKEFSVGFVKYFLFLIILMLFVAAFATGYGIFEIYAGCRFTTTKFVYWPEWGKATHALSRALLNCFLCMFPYCLLFCFFGDKVTRVPLYISATSSLGASAWAIFNAMKPMLKPTLALLPSYGFFVIALVASSHYVGHKIKSPTFRHLFMGQFVMAAITLVLYDFLIVPFYVDATSIQKSVVRILIHPGISALNLFISRSCSSRINPYIPGTQAFPVLIFMWFSTYYGRFFNSNMSLTMMTITMSIVSILELLWRTTLKPRDKKIVNAICGYCFKKQLTHSANFNNIYRDFLRLEQLYENVSIVTAACVYLGYYNVFDPENLSYSRILSGMAIQYALEWATDAISMYIESRYYRMDVLSFQKPAKGFYFMITYTFLLGMAYSTSRIILIASNEWLGDSNDFGSSH
ncbi:hypothetical protein DLAC_05842 [Tieghemostelium lacteum]|uniref:Transmembrane protein n=1 Tax=Tieghemostelium lacteum TaxID=361077 RepID=A0A151ZGW0_TIELA|nr:hypothetical protein DLAC_05842 [Tieghemostelium lacteum]|eukprot:KYQ93203.1 hypothetical protein DLAC_05842 [Tieghemostelium lacteum]